MAELIYEVLNSDWFLVKGDRNKYKKVMFKLGRWNSEIGGWKVTKNMESDLKKIATFKEKESVQEPTKKKYHRAISNHSDDDIPLASLLSLEKNLETVKTQEKPIEKEIEPKKETSDVESNHQSEKSVSEESPPVKEKHRKKHHSSPKKEKLSRAKKAVRESKHVSRKSTPEEYYKSFSKRPSKFQDLERRKDSDSASSDSSVSSSSDDFPMPITPVKRRR